MIEEKAVNEQNTNRRCKHQNLSPYRSILQNNTSFTTVLSRLSDAKKLVFFSFMH